MVHGHFCYFAVSYPSLFIILIHSQLLTVAFLVNQITVLVDTKTVAVVTFE
jgi:hypothetical protein